MKIIDPNGNMREVVFCPAYCTGYVAQSLIMSADDIRRIRELALHSPETFQAAMLQLEHRFVERRKQGLNIKMEAGK